MLVRLLIKKTFLLFLNIGSTNAIRFCQNRISPKREPQWFVVVYSRHNPGKSTHDTWQSGSEVGKGRQYLACTLQITLVGSWNMIHQNSLEEQEAVAAESREPVVFLQWLHLPPICPGLLWSHWLSGTLGDRNLDTADPRSYKEPSVKTHRCLQNNIVENRKVSPKKIGQDLRSICL